MDQWIAYGNMLDVGCRGLRESNRLKVAQALWLRIMDNQCSVVDGYYYAILIMYTYYRYRHLGLQNQSIRREVLHCYIYKAAVSRFVARQYGLYDVK